MISIADKDYKLLFYFIFIAMVLFIVADPSARTHIYPSFTEDESYWYKSIVADWNANGIQVIPSHHDTKPLSFLYIEKILKADETVVYTRALNAIIVIAITILIYSMTRRKESFLYVIIPIFLNSMWLTAEILEVFFVILSLKYINHRGIFIGLAAVFRPYAVLYAILINNKQRLYVVGIGIAFSLVLLYHGLFFPYASHLFNYAANRYYDLVDTVAIIYLIPLFIIGSRNKEMTKYSVISGIPLSIKLYGHYFIPIYSFLFMSYLLSIGTEKLESKEIHI